MADGGFARDFLACLRELDTSKDVAAEAELALAQLAAAGDELSYASMNKEYSYLYLLMGRGTRIFPYEAAFLHVAEKRDGSPSLFIAPRSLDVEQWMRRCGALPESAGTEPVDSIFGELDFMRLLYASLANALQLGDEEEASAWQRELWAFRGAHIDAWVEAFMRRTIELTRTPVYRALATLALLALEATRLPISADEVGGD
jgi:TorA maturation chaperone TorD